MLCKPDGRLHQPLGNRISAKQKWNWSFQHANETLYCQEGKTWVKYQLDRQTLTDATDDINTIRITLPATFELKQTVPSVQDTTFIKCIQTLKEWEHS
eukprot:2087232-Ditylum_brightwellii.AAC.1